MREDRLMDIIGHLEHGQLLHDKFHFDHFHVETVCGTSGCAVGEFPAIWPNDWEFFANMPTLIRGPYIRFGEHLPNVIVCTMDWLEIDYQTYQKLFVPRDSLGSSSVLLKEKELCSLYKNATKEEVASNIRKFIKLQKQIEHESDTTR